MQILDVQTAVGHICQACDTDFPSGGAGAKSPFFFLIGSGISSPQVPLAAQIEEECRALAKQQGRNAEPTSADPMERYSHWFTQAYQQPKQRQGYLRRLIENKPISPANLRLAHLLLDPRLANVVVTTNFDDFLCRALTLFGKPHIVCDHPRTTERIDPERDDVQIIHVHGTYWFYDCCNLKREIETRANPSDGTTSSMFSLLENIMVRRSPLVLGYGGWEADVIMRALRNRLSRSDPLPSNVYWFCYRAANCDSLPIWLKQHPQVFFVMPPAASVSSTAQTAITRTLDPTAAKVATMEFGRSEVREDLPDKDTLPAARILEEMIRVLKLENPELAVNPLRFFKKHLSASLVLPEEGDRDVYSIGAVIDRVGRAARDEQLEDYRSKLAPIRNALGRSLYGEAIQAAAAVDSSTWPAEHVAELLDAVFVAATGVQDRPEEALAGYDQVQRLYARLPEEALSLSQRVSLATTLVNKARLLFSLHRGHDVFGVCAEIIRRFGDATEAPLRDAVARAMVSNARALGEAGKLAESAAAYDEMIRRFGNSSELVLREHVGRALLSKALMLEEAGKGEWAITAYDEMVGRFGDATELPLREQVATALLRKGQVHGKAGKWPHAIAACDEVFSRSGDATELPLRERAAEALIYKGIILHEAGKPQEAVVACDEVLSRFGHAADLPLREWVASALAIKAVVLKRAGLPENAMAAWDEVLRRFGDATELSLREHAANALVFKGLLLEQLRRPQEAIVAFDEVLRRFENATEPPLRVQVAMALVNKGLTLGAADKLHEALAVYSDVLRRFGNATELPLREQIAMALVNKGLMHGAAGEGEEAMATWDEVLRRFGDSTDLPLREQIAEALICKWLRLELGGQLEQAVAVLDELLRRFSDATELPLREKVAGALVSKAETLVQMGQLEKAVATWDEVLRRFREATELALREKVAGALVSKGRRLGEAGRREEAVAAYNEVLRRFGDATELPLRKRVTEALANINSCKDEMGRGECLV